jgi:hypothetical protein
MFECGLREAGKHTDMKDMEEYVYWEGVKDCVKYGGQSAEL